MITKKIKDRILEVFSNLCLTIKTKSLSSGALVSASAVFLSFLVVTLILHAAGRNPSGMYQAILQAASGFDSRRGTWNVRFIGEWLVLSMPLILCALSMGFSVRFGLFNLGAEGQYIAGLTAAQLIAVSFTRVPAIAAVLGAMAAGLAWGAVAGFFKARYRVSEVLGTVMMNFIALYIHRLVTLRVPGSSVFRTPDFPASVSLSNPMLASLTNNSRLHNGLWLVVLAVLVYWLIMKKKTDTGIHGKTNFTVVMAISGAFAGLAGAVVSLGMFTHGRVLTVFDGYGFEGIAAALAGGCTALGIVIMGLFFGILKSAQPLMHTHQIPGEIVLVIMGLIVVFISLRPGIKIFTDWRRKAKK